MNVEGGKFASGASEELFVDPHLCVPGEGKKRNIEVVILMSNFNEITYEACTCDFSGMTDGSLML